MTTTDKKAIEVLETSDKLSGYFRVDAIFHLIISVVLLIIGFLLCFNNIERIKIGPLNSPINNLNHSTIIENGIITNEYRDKDNHLVKWFHTDLNGTLVDVDHDGWVYHSAVSEYVDGVEMSWTIYSHEGYTQLEYDKQGRSLKRTSFDKEGNPWISLDGGFYGENGFYRVEWEYDPEPGIAQYEIRYSKNGIERVSYNNDRNGILRMEFFNNDWTARIDPASNCYRYDYSFNSETGELESSTNYYEESTTQYYYDGEGRVIRAEWYDLDGNRKKDAELGCYAHEWRYFSGSDDVVESILYYDDYYHKQIYNENGTLIREEIYDTNGKLTACKNHTYTSVQIENKENGTNDVPKLVRITAQTVNLRNGPGTEYSIVVSAKNGNVLDYAGLTETDSRGIEWYSVVHPEKGMAWVSSKYSEIQVTSDN